MKQINGQIFIVSAIGSTDSRWRGSAVSGWSVVAKAVIQKWFPGNAYRLYPGMNGMYENRVSKPKILTVLKNLQNLL